MAPVEADWSQLPKELLSLISERLDNEFDLIRFRSVCPNWRSSSSSSSSFSILNHHNNILSFKFPLLKYLSTTDSIFLSKRSIFLIKPQQQSVSPWLITVIQNSSGKTKLFQSSLIPFQLPSTFSLDLTKFSVLHFGTDFIVDEPLVQRYGVLRPKKVVYVSPLILAILFYDDMDMVLFRCGDDYWTDIPGISDIQDICIFKGRIYAVELSGKTVTVELEDLSVRKVAKKTNDFDRLKFLVESDGELLLVNISEMLDDADDDDDDLGFKDALCVDVYKLDEKEKKWVTLTSLGDRILFLGDGYSFSASASDLSVAEGNCIIFMDDVFNDYRICDSGMCVYHLDPGQLSHIDYLNLFRPPAKWTVKGGRRKTKKRAKQRKRA